MKGISRTLKLPIQAYRRWISPLKPPTCRFYPTCSAYALEAIEIHGAAKGSWLAARRICKCHPFHPGGLDPVPPKRITDLS
ncbi:membrane protein insertion efficiency factor YidD [Paenibacillus swuensis]|uniref:membrane protein insertion efficiency factor YidD n=1 Tax=Paenibacillus swuensis TaxID=1178515 RepID=UPI0009ECE13A|nr:membrane protein insertion efficiency factor YidD [Paenibacillus swuensis]